MMQNAMPTMINTNYYETSSPMNGPHLSIELSNTFEVPERTLVPIYKV